MRKFWPLLLALLLVVGPALAQQPLSFQITGPAGSNPLVNSPSPVTNSQIVGVLTPLSSQQYTYLCGFVVSSAGTTTPQSATVTVTGTVNTMNFVYDFVSSGQGILGVALGPGCITSSAKNTPIIVTVPAGGGGTTESITVWGFSL